MPKYGISTYGTSVGISGDEIKNLALFELGYSYIVDFTDLTNATVIKVNTPYSNILLECLSEYPWRFIMKRVQLTNRTDATDSEKYKYNFIFPANLLTMRTCYTDANYSNPITEFESYPAFINTDNQTCYCWYSSIMDEEAFPQYFIHYFKYKLARSLCFNLTGDSELEKKLAMAEESFYVQAKNADAKQSPVRTIKASPFTSIRR